MAFVSTNFPKFTCYVHAIMVSDNMVSFKTLAFGAFLDLIFFVLTIKSNIFVCVMLLEAISVVRKLFNALLT